MPFSFQTALGITKSFIVFSAGSITVVTVLFLLHEHKPKMNRAVRRNNFFFILLMLLIK